VSSCGAIETVHRLFLECNFFGTIWHQVRQWIGFSSLDPNQVSDYFIQFSQSADSSKSRCSSLQLVWFSVVWEIWRERNNRLFNNKKDLIY